MSSGFTIGDVIRKARVAKRLNQEQLGDRAAHYALRPNDERINKSTVSKVERDPYTSKFGTVWRLIAAVGLTLADVERMTSPPFAKDVRSALDAELDQIRATTPPGHKRATGSRAARARRSKS